MYLKDSQGNTVKIVIGGEWIDDIEILEATYPESGLEVSDDEVAYILETHYDKISQEILENAMDQASRYEF